MRITDKVLENDGEVQELVVHMIAEADEVDAAIKKFFKNMSETADVPGFRKGKVPKSVVEAGLGGHEQAYTAAAEQMMNDLAFHVIDGDDIIFISDPEFNVTEVMQDGKPYKFTVSGQVAPTIKLEDAGPVTIEMPPDEATDSEIDKHIENLRDYYHTFENIDDEAHVAEMGDYVNMTITCTTSEGKAISGLNEVDRLVGLGKGTMPATFDEHIIGAKAGDKLEFDFDPQSTEVRPEFGEGDLHAAVEINSFRKCIIPDLDDDFAMKLGSENLEALRKQVKNALDDGKNRDLPQLMEQRVVDALVSRVTEEPPAYFVEFLRQDVSRELVNRLEQEGTSLQDWVLQNDVQREALMKQIKEEAERRAKREMALEALFVAQGLELTDEDIDKEFAGTDDPEGQRKMWEDADRVADLRKLCRQNKTIRWLIKTAEVVVEED